MKTRILVCALVAVGGLVACGSPSTGTDAGTTYDVSSASKINAYLEGKTMLMTGTDIPNSPNGFSENVDFGTASQCYASTSIAVLGGNWNVTSKLATIQKPDGGGAVGTCDHTWNNANPMTFASTAVLIDNVQGNATCFDIDVTYTGFAQQGRGKISEDGKTVTLELFFKDRAVNIRCADGAVGSGNVMSVTMNGNVAFTGNAQQTYRIQ